MNGAVQYQTYCHHQRHRQGDGAGPRVPRGREGLPDKTLPRRLGGGDTCEETKQQNDEALEAERNGNLIDSLFSVYVIDGTEIFIITEIDRSATTVLFPKEY